MSYFLSYLPDFGPLQKLLESGGFVVVILLMLSLFVSTIIILKLWQFVRMGFFLKPNVQQIIQEWISGNRASAYHRVESKKNPTAKVMAHLMRGMQRSPTGERQVREDVERVAEIELAKVRSYFSAIEAVVQIAPLLGLFGTVIGMIEAFQNLQTAGSEVDPSILAGGIWVALLTTAVGLAVAIPSAFILYWFESMANREQHNIETAVTGLLTQCLTDEAIHPHKIVKRANNIKPSEHAA